MPLNSHMLYKMQQAQRNLRRSMNMTRGEEFHGVECWKWNGVRTRKKALRKCSKWAHLFSKWLTKLITEKP